MNGATRRGFLGLAAAPAGAVAAPTRAVARSSQRFTDVAISTGDVILAARTIGRGEPIVMHPSLARGGRDFDALALRLAARGYRVISFDPRGIGQSWAPASALEGLDLHAYARDMLAVVDHFELERAHVFGHAYGNRVARTFATDHPKRSATVILCACGGGIPTPEVVLGLSEVTDPETSAAEIRRVTKRVFFAPGNDPSPWYLGWYAAAGCAEQLSVVRTDFAAIEGGADRPTLIVKGKQDIVAPPAIGHDLRRRYGRRITVRDLDHAGHAMIIERTDAVARVMLDFLARHPLGRG